MSYKERFFWAAFALAFVLCAMAFVIDRPEYHAFAFGLALLAVGSAFLCLGIMMDEAYRKHVEQQRGHLKVVPPQEEAG